MENYQEPGLENQQTPYQEEPVPITFIFDGGDADEVVMKFPVFWWEFRMDDIRMERKGDLFEARVELPRNSLIPYLYVAPNHPVEGTERYGILQQVSRVVHVMGPMTISDNLYAWGPEEVDRPITMRGKIFDRDTGEPVVDAFVVADGITAFPTGDGSYEVNIRTRRAYAVAYLLDGSYKTQSKFVEFTAGETVDFELEKAKPAKVKIEIDANPPPYHKVRIYSTAEQTGARFWYLNRFLTDVYKEIEGSIELDLYEGQYVDYLYTIGNPWVGYEIVDGRYNTRHFVARDGLVVRDKIENFFDEEPITMNVRVPDYTDPRDIIGINGFYPLYLFMHPKGDNEWVLKVQKDLLGRKYFYYKSFFSDGSETRMNRDLTPPVTDDVVEAWYYQSKAGPTASFPAPTVKRIFDIFIFPYDYYSSSHAMLMDRETDRIAQKGFQGIVLSQIWGYEPLEPLPKLQRSGIMALYTPLFELKRVTALAHAKGLKVTLFSQMVGAEGVLHTGKTFDDGWWDQWLDEMEKFNLYNARTAQAAGVEYLKLQDRQPGLYMQESYMQMFNARMKEIIAKMRAVYTGKIIAEPYVRGEGMDYWHLGDIVALDMQGGIDLGASQEEMNRAVAARLDSNFKWVHEESGKLLLIDQLSSGILGPLEPDMERGNPFTEEELVSHWEGQAKWQRALFEAVNERDWIAGVYLFPYGFTDAPESIDANVRGKPAEELASTWAKKMSEME